MNDQMNADLLSNSPMDLTNVIINITPKNVQDKSCCCCKIAYFPDADLTLCGHWILKPLKPILIVTSYLIMFSVGVYDIVEFSGIKLSCSVPPCVVLGLYSLIFMFLMISYFSVIIRGPGYLPFNYSIYKKKNLDWKEAKDSFAVYKEQVEFARQSDHPPRSSFSLIARRYILRADHFCIWTESWIGVKNHRHFLLMTFYAFLFSTFYFGSHYWWLKANFIKNTRSCGGKPKWFTIVMSIVVGLALLIIAFFAIYHFCVSARNLAINFTAIEKWKGEMNPKHSEFDRGSCLNNYEEVCGPKRFCFLWFIPCINFKPVVDGFYSTFLKLYSNVQ